MAGKTGGKILGVIGLALAGFVTWASAGAIWANPSTAGAMLALIGTSVALIKGPRRSKSLDATGADKRSIPKADPGALGAYIFGTTLVPMSLIYDELWPKSTPKAPNA